MNTNKELNDKAVEELQNNYIKILFVNLTTMLYDEVVICKDEKDIISKLNIYNRIDLYWEWFISSNIIHNDDIDVFVDFCKKHEPNSSIVYRRKFNNSYIHVLMEIKPCVTYSEKNKECMLYVRDIDSIYRREFNIAMEKAKRIDTMTNLLSHSAYLDDIKKTYRGNIGIAFIDINGLKFVNDTYSHAEGDNLIHRAVKILKETFPAYYIYKIGGDEFVVIAPNVKIRIFLHTAVALHKRIWNDISTYTKGKYIGGMEGIYENFPMFSIGYSADVAEDITDIISDAEKQMYEDKEMFYDRYPNYKR